MSDPRQPWLILTKKLPQKQGKKSVKIEVFRAKLWAERILPGSKSRGEVAIFDPGPRRPMRTEELEGFNRLRIDDQWLRLEGYDYSFVTESESFEVFRKFSWNSSFEIKYWSENNS